MAMSSYKLLNIFIKNVNKRLRKDGITKSDLARMLKISPQGIGRYLGGEHIPGLDKVELISEALGVSAASLLVDEAEVNRPPEGVSSQEKLQAAAQQLNDAEAALLLEQAQHFLMKRLHKKKAL